jgi:hypothetical protein
LWSAALLLAAAAAVLFLVVWAPWKPEENPPGEQVFEPFPVAVEDEIEIVRIDGADTDLVVIGRPPLAESVAVAQSEEIEVMRVNGADTDALPVGRLPVHGPLVLAQAGEVSFRHMDAGVDQREPEVHMGNQETPMVWARMEGEAEN